jgi:hypothetical protein
VAVALGTMPEEQVTEFRAGTVDDLLVAAKGGATPAADDAKRYKSLAMGAGASSLVLALALVVVLITGAGGKSDTKSDSTTATTVKPLDAPPGTSGTPVVIPSAQASSVKQGGYLTIAGNNRIDGAEIKIQDALVLAVNTETKPGATKDSPPTTVTTAQVAIPNDQLNAYANIDPKSQKVFVTSGPSATTTTAPPATTPPPADPATTTPSS